MPFVGEKFITLAEERRFPEAVEDYVRQYDWVTLVELRDHLESYMDVHGSLAWCHKDDEHLIFWAGMSREFLDVVQSALVEGRIHMHPSSWLTYLIDGSTLTLPVAKNPPKKGYRKDRWLPICFRVVPLPEKAGRRKGKERKGENGGC